MLGCLFVIVVVGIFGWLLGVISDAFGQTASTIFFAVVTIGGGGLVMIRDFKRALEARADAAIYVENHRAGLTNPLQDWVEEREADPENWTVKDAVQATLGAYQGIDAVRLLFRQGYDDVVQRDVVTALGQRLGSAVLGQLYLMTAKPASPLLGMFWFWLGFSTSRR